VSLDVEETIVAISSASGNAARAILRISGPAALDIAFAITDAGVPELKQATVVGCNLPLDEHRQLSADFWVWPTQRSYTRQPQVEIHLVGNAPIANLVLRKLLTAGARLAKPGEFTLRAFLAGRMDLTQAEAVLGVIDAEAEVQLTSALGQLAGGLSNPLDIARAELIELVALLEAGLDFVEEDIEFITAHEVRRRVESIRTRLTAISQQIQSRHVDQVLPKVVLMGKPNAGKSSLFNAIAKSDEAIVSDVAGTTRDYLSKKVQVGGTSFELIDTAGIEQVEDPAKQIEKMSQARTSSAIDSADLCLVCREVSSKSDDGCPIPKEHCIMVGTKQDAGDVAEREPFDFLTSAKTGVGIDGLLQEIAQRTAADRQHRSEYLPANVARAQNSIAATVQALEMATRAIDGELGEEIVAAELRTAIHELAELVGAVYTDDLLDVIFSKFCIGK